MKEVYPEYAADVDFYAVGVHPGIVEDITALEDYRREQGHPWPVATAPGQVMADLGVTIQSTKLAFNSRGVITYREGMGLGDDETWRQVFGGLAEPQ